MSEHESGFGQNFPGDISPEKPVNDAGQEEQDKADANEPDNKLRLDNAQSINYLETKSVGFETATSFDELYDMLRHYGEIAGQKEIFSPGEVITSIEAARRDLRFIDTITRSFKIRATVRRLLRETVSQHKNEAENDFSI